MQNYDLGVQEMFKYVKHTMDVFNNNFNTACVHFDP